LESKQAERLDGAVQRFQELLQPGAVLGVQHDVSSLSGQSGKHSVPLSPEKGLAGLAASGKNGGSTTAPPPSGAAAAGVRGGGDRGVQEICGVTQAAAAAGLTDGAAPGSCTAVGTGVGSCGAVPARPLLSD
jgi:hypothetical protein